MGNSLSMCIRSSCFPNQTVTLQAASGFNTPGRIVNTNNCSNSGNQNFPIFIMVYQANVVLLGRCSDYHFQVLAQCCRVDENNVTNISNYGSSTNIQNLFIAFLNNTLANNDSPTFDSTPQSMLCAGQKVNIFQNVTESNGDSLDIRFSNVKSLGSVCMDVSNAVNSVFASGFEVDKPFNTTGNAAIPINQNTGNISFEAGPVIGLYVFSVTVDEYRLHPSGNFQYKIGSVSRELMLNFVDCTDPAIVPNFLRQSLPGNFAHFNTAIFTNYRAFMMGYTPKDSIVFAASPTGYAYPMRNVLYDCQDSLITLFLRQQIINNTADASQFFVVGPDTQVTLSQRLYFSQNEFSDTVYLKLSQPLRFNGQHFIVILKDSLNPMLTVCGSEFVDTMVYSLQASNCPDNLSVSSEITPQFRPTISPNPAEHTVSIFNPSSGRLQFEIYDLQGRRYRTGEIEARSKTTCQIADLTSGVYVIVFHDEQGRRLTQKIIRQ